MAAFPSKSWKTSRWEAGLGTSTLAIPMPTALSLSAWLMKMERFPFSIESNGTLRTTTSFDFEIENEDGDPTLQIQVRVSDEGNATFDKSFSVLILDQFEDSAPPTTDHDGSEETLPGKRESTIISPRMATSPNLLQSTRNPSPIHMFGFQSSRPTIQRFWKMAAFACRAKYCMMVEGTFRSLVFCSPPPYISAKLHPPPYPWKRMGA